MAIYYRQIENQIVVTGKTYPYRDMIKSFGGRFQTTEKTWLLPANDGILEQVAKLCKSVGGGPIKDAKVKVETTIAVTKTTITPEPLPNTATSIPIKDGYSVADLMNKVQLAIHAAFPKTVWIMGEIQNIAQRKQGCFFELADGKEGASQSATMTVKTTLWQTTQQLLERKHGKNVFANLLQDGIKVRLLCQVSLYRDRGQVTLQVMDVDPDYTRGALALQREQLLRELRAKGLDTQNKSRGLTPFPFRVGLVSAEGSRAKSDFLDQLCCYKFPGEVLFYPAQMQGENLLKEVVRGIQILQDKECDVIVITRGGGSAADLRWFDSREVAYAIAEAKIPIIAAIGHHDDVCVAEEIAYRREKTPTAAADFLVHTFKSTRELIDTRARQLSMLMDRCLEQQIKLHQHFRQRLTVGTQHILEREKVRLTHASAGLQARTERQLTEARQRLLGWWHKAQMLLQRSASREGEILFRHQLKLREAANQVLLRKTQELQVFENKLVSVDPRPWLQKGWTQLFNENKKLVRNAGDVATGQTLHARLLDAVLKLRIDDVNPTTKEASE